MAVELMPKRFELMSELVPQTTAMALLWNPTGEITEGMVRDMREMVRVKGMQLHVLKATTEDEIDAAFASLDQFGPVTGLSPARHGFFDEPGLGIMLCEEFGLAIHQLGEVGLERFGDLRVQLQPSIAQQAAMRRVLHQRVLEAVDRLRWSAALEDQFGSDETSESSFQFVVGKAGYGSHKEQRQDIKASISFSQRQRRTARVSRHTDVGVCQPDNLRSRRCA